MSVEIKIGQRWKDRDKRRPGEFEITDVLDKFGYVAVKRNGKRLLIKISRLQKRYEPCQSTLVDPVPLLK